MRSKLQISRSKEFHFGDSLMLFHATLYPEGVYWLPVFLVLLLSAHIIWEGTVLTAPVWSPSPWAPSHLAPTPGPPVSPPSSPCSLTPHLVPGPHLAPLPLSDPCFLPAMWPPCLAPTPHLPLPYLAPSASWLGCLFWCLFQSHLTLVQAHLVCSPPRESNIFHLTWKKSQNSHEATPFP